MLKIYLIIWIWWTTGQFHLINAYRINLTNVENCKRTTNEINNTNNYTVELLSVIYDYVDDVCDTIHGTYIVHTIDTDDKELLVKLYECDLEHDGQCNENHKEYTERLHCERFNGDDSGPWFMFSSAMSGSKCGEETGTFTLDYAQMKTMYLKKYLIENGINSKYHLYMMFHKKGEMDELSIRGCLSIEFTTIY